MQQSTLIQYVPQTIHFNFDFLKLLNKLYKMNQVNKKHHLIYSYNGKSLFVKYGWKQYYKMAVLHFFLVIPLKYIFYSLWPQHNQGGGGTVPPPLAHRECDSLYNSYVFATYICIQAFGLNFDLSQAFKQNGCRKPMESNRNCPFKKLLFNYL